MFQGGKWPPVILWHLCIYLLCGLSNCPYERHSPPDNIRNNNVHQGHRIDPGGTGLTFCVSLFCGPWQCFRVFGQCGLMRAKYTVQQCCTTTLPQTAHFSIIKIAWIWVVLAVKIAFWAVLGARMNKSVCNMFAVRKLKVEIKFVLP